MEEEEEEEEGGILQVHLGGASPKGEEDRPGIYTSKGGGGGGAAASATVCKMDTGERRRRRRRRTSGGEYPSTPSLLGSRCQPGLWGCMEGKLTNDGFLKKHTFSHSVAKL